jgi:hypothetical protein
LRVLCAVAACLTIGVIAVSLLPSTATKLGLIIAEVMAITPLVLAVGSFACPRCEQPFFTRSNEHASDFLTKECRHCGLARGTSASKVREAKAVMVSTQDPSRN